jgi:hypothetical protein
MAVVDGTVFIGAGVSAVGAGICLARSRSWFVRNWAVALLTLLVFELACVLGPVDLLAPTWWLLHTPSILLLGVDEIVERHGPLVATTLHLADLVLWAAVVAGAIVLVRRAAGRSGRTLEPSERSR